VVLTTSKWLSVANTAPPSSTQRRRQLALCAVAQPADPKGWRGTQANYIVPRMPNRGDFLRARNEAFSIRLCLAPEAMKVDCSTKIIAAHLIQRRGMGLKTIAEDGNVLTPAQHTKERHIYFKEVSTASASTFSGFCKHHDQALFMPLETTPLLPTDEQIFLQTYRSTCNEFYMKGGANIFSADVETRLMPNSDKASAYAAGVRRGLEDALRYKTTLDTMLASGDLSRLKYIAYLFDKPPQVFCSTGVLLDYGFQGQILQRWRPNVDAYGVTFSMIAREGGGLAVFAWVDDVPATKAFARSLLRVPIDAIPSMLVHYSFEYSENVYVSPRWRKGLAPREEEVLLSRYRSGVEESRSRIGMTMFSDVGTDWRVLEVRTK